MARLDRAAGWRPRRLAEKYWLLALGLAAWELSGALGLTDPAFVPSLSQTLSATRELWERAFLFNHVMVSLTRVLIGLIMALAVAVPFGYALGRAFPAAAEALGPLLRVFGLINPYCLFPLFVVFFGSGETPKIAVLAWVSLWPIFFSTLTGVRNVDPVLLDTGRSMGAGKLTSFLRIVLPAAAPQVFSGLRIGVGMSFFILIAAEMTGATAGLGWIIHSAGALYQVPRIYGAGLCVVALGVGLNRFLVFLQNGLFFWKESVDPLLGAERPSQGGKRISSLKIALALAAFLLVLAVGVHEIILAEVRLNDPTAIPEYRVWSR
ncbi:MAG: ABC transporter permease [Deltaproteobacteria bacterium]|jgi:NitT/TauT family transport system permease protein|nr:ABC transporter permease [Deltaproteobacteria bacterium]